MHTVSILDNSHKVPFRQDHSDIKLPLIPCAASGGSMGGRIPKKEFYCDIHPLTLLICPRCIGPKGGKATARNHSHAQLAAWGRMGGRPKKKSKKKKRTRR